MAYKKSTKKHSNGRRTTKTINDGLGKAKSGTRNTNSIQSGKGTNYSQRTSYSQGPDGRTRTTTITNQSGWTKRTTNTTKKPKKLKSPKKGSRELKIQQYILKAFLVLGGIILFLELLKSG